MTSQAIQNSQNFPRPDAQGFWWPIIGLTLLTLLLLIGHQTSILQIFYPGAVFLIAVYLYIKYPVQFFGYIWWVFFLTPEVRRLSDFVQGSFTVTSLIMAAPLLVSTPLAFTMLRRIRYLGTKPGLPILLILLALAYGYVVGILNSGFAAATFGLATWITPVFLGFHLAVSWRQFPEFKRCLLRTFTIGTAVCAGYGVIQYMFLPPWDASWMIWSGMTSSMGNAAPYQLRVFGPLNSLAPFTSVVGAGVLCTTVALQNRGRSLAAIFGVIALALSFVRSAWGGAVIGICYQMLFFNNRTRIRIFVGALVVSAAIIPVFMSNNVSDNLQQRFNTLSDLKSDNSFNARSNFYNTFLDQALTNIVGIGTGGTGLGTKLSDDSSTSQYENFDSGLMEIPFVLGWPGALLYIVGILWLFISAGVAAVKGRADRFTVAWFSIALGIFAQLIFGNSFIGLPGQIIFMGMVLPIMAIRYAKYQDALLRKQIDDQVFP